MTLVRGCENGNRTDRNRLEKGIPGSDVSMSRFCLTRLLSMYIYIYARIETLLQSGESQVQLSSFRFLLIKSRLE